MNNGCQYNSKACSDFHPLSCSVLIMPKLQGYFAGFLSSLSCVYFLSRNKPSKRAVVEFSLCHLQVSRIINTCHQEKDTCSGASKGVELHRGLVTFTNTLVFVSMRNVSVL